MSRQDHYDLMDVRSKPVEYGGEYKAEEEDEMVFETMPKKRNLPPNPKDIMGAKKVDSTVVPSVAFLHLATAMMDGAGKYGPYNWRDSAVEARTYVAAAKRHLDAWLEREEVAEDSGVHHLGHAMACCAILLDAMNEDKLIDNRPLSSGQYHRAAKKLNEWAKKRSEQKKE